MRHLAARLDRVGQVRLALAVVLIVLAWLSWHAHLISPLWLLLPAAAFAGAVVYHALVRRRQVRTALAAALYRRGLARIEDRWPGSGRQGRRFDDVHHVYAADLDLFGRGSLFELICAARTRIGEETLARWLLAPASREEVLTRQACVADLRSRLELREDLATVSLGEPPLGEAEGHDAARGDAARGEAALLAWAESPSILERTGLRWVAVSLPAALVACAAVWAWAGTWIPFAAALLLEAGILRALRGRLGEVLDPVERAFDEVRELAGLASRIEREPFESAAMRALAGGLSSGGHTASRAIARLGTLAQLAGSRRNLAVKWLLAVPFLYSIHVALAAERWRREHGAAIRAWLEAVGRFEALSSLGQYAFEHPDDAFPQLLTGDACLCAEGLGHPLIPAARCVRNDVELGGSARVLLVSGSNMSGKSTLLRAVGLNAVLAMAGAPVRARSLRLTPLEVGASIRVNDSLREGASRFYAEITRLRQLYELSARGRPLLFLIDEMLQGTNSKDRRIGAEAILKALVAAGSIGLATTHDLALTEIAGLAEGALRNVHFEDRIENGRIEFDFRLRDGIVTRSNGIELMRAIGLQV